MFIDKIKDKFSVFQNKPIHYIEQIVSLNTKLFSKKTSVATLSNTMLAYLNIDKAILSKQNILVKTVCLKSNLKPKESMSFEKVNFQEVVKENWETSFLYEKFSKTTFLFMVFQYVEDVLYFKGVHVWKMPQATIDNELHDFWTMLQSRLQQGVTLEKVQRGKRWVTQNDLPSTADSSIMHIRPKASNAQDVVELPDGQLITKQAYWFNATYIARILEKMPSLKPELIKQNPTQCDYKKFKPLLTKDIYTIEQFILLAQTIEVNFDELHIDEQQLSTIGYKLSAPYIIEQQWKNAAQYLIEKVLSRNYFKIPEDSIWQTSFANRQLTILENNYDIFKIDDTTYLTIVALNHTDISKDVMKSYRLAVEAFIETGQFFTIQSLRQQDFQHPLDDFGFDIPFYESLLKRPGYLQYINLGDHTIFVKSAEKPTRFTLFKALLGENDSLDIDDLAIIIEEQWHIFISVDQLEKVLAYTEPLKPVFYSEDLQKLFSTKEMYLKYVY